MAGMANHRRDKQKKAMWCNGVTHWERNKIFLFEASYFNIKPSTEACQKRHNRHTHNKTLKDTYNYFVLDNESKASFFKFSKRRPAKVLTVGQTNIRRCLCEKCINIEMQFKGLTRKAEKNRLKPNMKQTKLLDVANLPYPKWYCSTCDTEWLKDYLGEEVCTSDTSVQWYKWESVKFCSPVGKVKSRKNCFLMKER